MLSKTSASLEATTGTGAKERAAELLAEYGWTDEKWKNRVSQLHKWLFFFDEEGRPALPAGEGEFMAYVGYLSLEGRVWPTSARHYVTTVSRYHEDAGYDSPTKTRLVLRLLKAYEKMVDRFASEKLARAGLDAGVIRRIVALVLDSDDREVVCSCAMLLFAFVFQCRSATVIHVTLTDLKVSDTLGIRAKLVYQKAKRASLPLLLIYPLSSEWEDGTGRHLLLARW
ncbi:hypothetical protein BWQ96_06918 [Gracilariopsis chorda]|uniref:Uncharacterized protein n=1 Tax=Gracilariopsis chorda TaxID=448386 RepID=A0A2V3IMP3_9FLOR|nr:hypothetical protein BWQ96_06918 [Gracilariopsis chorda]|eukprot:PXF43355.1 hypothetical protein BWQ96_06918 [Gracilariopsis chorda]